MTGKLKLKLVDGRESESEFVQRVVFVGEGEETRMKLVEVWAVSLFFSLSSCCGGVDGWMDALF
jgi:hypothetical protein